MPAVLALLLAAQTIVDRDYIPDVGKLCKGYYQEKRANLAKPIGQRPSDDDYERKYFSFDKDGTRQKMCLIYFMGRSDEAEATYARMKATASGR